MKVELLDHMGTDLTVVNSARVSFAKESEWVEKCSCGSTRDTSQKYNQWPGCGADVRSCPASVSRSLAPKDAKLIQYLAAHNHWTVFGHCFASFRVKCPIFVCRQLAKHQVGLVINEISYRYVEPELEFHMPELRLAAANAKQGSSSEVLTNEGMQHWYVQDAFDDAYAAAESAYQTALDHGVAKEVARAVLPVATPTEFIWSGSLAAWARVCKLRLDSHAQKETRLIAEGIAEHCHKLWPVSWNALMADASKSRLDRIKTKVLDEVYKGDSDGLIGRLEQIFEQS